MKIFALNYLLNALWQAPLLFVAAWLAAFALRRLGPRAEHRLWVTTLVAQCVLPALEAPGLMPALHALFSQSGDTRTIVTISMGTAHPLQTGLGQAVWRVLPALFLAVVAFCCVRFAWQSTRLDALARRAEPAVLSAAAQEFFDTCRRRLSLDKIDIRCSSRVPTPFVFGTRRPVLLLPLGFAERVPAPQLHAALAHELAHVRRRDYAKQVLYRTVAMPLCFHPAAALTLARISESREQVCDQMAAHMTGGTRRYADSLLGLASLLAARQPAPTPAVGIFDARHFERRILMLHHPLPIASRTRRAVTLLATGMVAAATCTSALALHRQVASPLDEVTAENAFTDGGQPAKVAPTVMAGQIVSKVQPKYPAEAKKAKVQGAVVLKAVIGKTGAVEHLQVVSGPELLRASALDAVRQWVYKPYLLNGEPVEVETNITVTYSFGESPAAPPQAQSAPEAWPKLISSVDPDYPEAAKKAKLSGDVVVALQVDQNGKVRDVHALSGPPELRAAATDAVGKYVFQPAILHGVPVPVDMRVEVKFEMF